MDTDTRARTSTHTRYIELTIQSSSAVSSSARRQLIFGPSKSNTDRNLRYAVSPPAITKLKKSSLCCDDLVIDRRSLYSISLNMSLLFAWILRKSGGRHVTKSLNMFLKTMLCHGLPTKTKHSEAKRKLSV